MHKSHAGAVQLPALRVFRPQKFGSMSLQTETGGQPHHVYLLIIKNGKKAISCI
jgi:hypothetical protein